jgi:cytoskeletal protein RodZ
MSKALISEKSLFKGWKSFFKGRKKDRSLMLPAVTVVLLLGICVLFFQISNGEKTAESYAGQSSESVSNSPGSILLRNKSAPAEQKTAQPSQLSDAEDRQIQNPGTSDSEPTESEAEVNQPELMISGTVLDDVGQLVPGATVEARYSDIPADDAATSPTSSQQLIRLTDNLGGFEFGNLDEGEYELTVTKGEEYGKGYQRVRAGMANAEVIL